MNTYKITCKHCKKVVDRESKQKYKQHDKSRKNTFCSQKCVHAYYNLSITQSCRQCGNPVKRALGQFRKSQSGNIFCDKSCACSFNNTQKRKSRRSKCEIYLIELLQGKYPNLDILATDKKLLDGYEVDIAIPSIGLAIEWNGIVHFKPIYGQVKLNKIQKRDAEKLKIASKKKINLIVIPDLVSTKTRVEEAFVEICKIIDQF